MDWPHLVQVWVCRRPPRQMANAVCGQLWFESSVTVLIFGLLCHLRIHSVWFKTTMRQTSVRISLRFHKHQCNARSMCLFTEGNSFLSHSWTWTFLFFYSRNSSQVIKGFLMCVCVRFFPQVHFVHQQCAPTLQMQTVQCLSAVRGTASQETARENYQIHEVWFDCQFLAFFQSWIKRVFHKYERWWGVDLCSRIYRPRSKYAEQESGVAPGSYTGSLVNVSVPLLYCSFNLVFRCVILLSITAAQIQHFVVFLCRWFGRESEVRVLRSVGGWRG